MKKTYAKAQCAGNTETIDVARLMNEIKRAKDMRELSPEAHDYWHDHLMYDGVYEDELYQDNELKF